MRIVAISAEGPNVVIKDAKGTEHVLEDGTQAWAAMWAILADPELGEAVKVNAAQQRAEQAFDDACQNFGQRVADQYGEVAGEAITGVAKRFGRHLHRMGRRISKR